MDIVFTDATQFERVVGTRFPHVSGDKIGLVVSLSMAHILRNLSPGADAEAFTQLFMDPNAVQYVIVSSEGIPKYSNVDIVVSGKYPIPLDLGMQRNLYDMVSHDTTEVSGLLTTDGIINYDNGDEKSAPKQVCMDEIIGFHTHPKKAYLNHKTNVGWPSGKDAVLERHRHLIFGLEGIYFISQPTTCFVPTKSHKTFSLNQTLDIAKRCSWILLPWTKEWWFY